MFGLAVPLLCSVVLLVPALCSEPLRTGNYSLSNANSDEYCDADYCCSRCLGSENCARRDACSLSSALNLNFTDVNTFTLIPYEPGHVIWYLIVDSFPILIVIPVILLFNINLAFGFGHSIAFFYQVLRCYLPYGDFYILSGFLSVYFFCFHFFIFITFHNPLLEILAFPLLDIPDPYSLPILLLSYIKALLAILYLGFLCCVISCSHLPTRCGCIWWSKLRRAVRHFREKHAYEGSVAIGTTSVLILIYGYIVELVFSTLAFIIVDCYCWSNPDMKLNGRYHAAAYKHHINATLLHHPSPYVYPSYILLALLLIPPLALVYYPGIQNLFYYVCNCNCPRLTKLDPIFDVLQGGFKHRLRFFAGLYLLYRIVIWSVWAFVPGPAKQVILTCVVTLILMVHSIFQPFQRRRDNYIESLNLLILILASLGSYTPDIFEPTYNVILKAILNTVTLFIPGSILIIYYLYKLVVCTCMRRCCPSGNPAPCSKWWKRCNAYEQLSDQL